MIYNEEKRDLFSLVNTDYYLVHCISADFKMGAGIAKEFQKRFDLRDDLLSSFGARYWQVYDDKLPGEAFIHNKKKVIDLVTKTRYWDKPTLYSIERALKRMEDGCKERGIKKLAMPKIGCGLDKLEWEDVSNLIKNIFEDTDIEILVCIQ